MSASDDRPSDDLAQALTPRSGAPADLDALIRARARDAVAARPAGQHAPRRTDRLRRLVPVAAVVLVAVGVVPMLLDGDRPEDKPEPSADQVAERALSREADALESSSDPQSAAVASARAMAPAPMQIEERLHAPSADAGAGASSDVDEAFALVLQLLQADRRDEAVAAYRVWRAGRTGSAAPDWSSAQDNEQRLWLQQQERRWQEEH